MLSDFVFLFLDNGVRGKCLFSASRKPHVSLCRARHGCIFNVESCDAFEQAPVALPNRIFSFHDGVRRFPVGGRAVDAYVTVEVIAGAYS